ncbi:MAG: hypothetical protein WC314_19395 [Vulcanimicrobiota bacterium]
MRNKLTIPDTIEISLSTEDFDNGLTNHRGLWLGRYTVEELIDDFEKFGIFPHLKRRGYTRVTPQLECEPFKGTLRITGWAGETEHLLVEVTTRRTTERVLGDLSERPYSTLVIDWVRFQDPCARFEDGLPQLPGQEHPGLQLLEKGTELMVEQVKSLDVDLVLTYPQHFHNAVFYAPRFQFLDPLTEGHFQALSRDLLEAGLAEVSLALEEGRVIDESGSAVYWLARAQVFPLSEKIRQTLYGRDYQAQVRKAKKARFKFRE